MAMQKTQPGNGGHLEKIQAYYEAQNTMIYFRCTAGFSRAGTASALVDFGWV